MKHVKFLGGFAAVAFFAAMAIPLIAEADGMGGGTSMGGVTSVKVVNTIPLPAGAASAAKQDDIITAIEAVDTTLGVPFQVGSSIGNTVFGATQSGTWTIAGVSGTISLPTGAATSALQTTQNTTMNSLFKSGQSIGNTVFGATQSGVWTVNPGNVANTTAWKVDGSGVTQPVSGTFWPATQPVSASSLPLPTGAATATLQSTINSTANSLFKSGQSIGNTTFASTQSGTWNINNVSGTISLPTGAATAAKQPSLGTAGSASPNVITVQGIASGTNLNVNCAVGCAATAQATASTYDTTNTSYATSPTGAQATTTAPSLTNGKIYTLTQNTSGGLRVDGSGVTQPVSGTVGATQSGTWNIGNITGTISLPTGAATSALQTTGNSTLTTINTSVGTLNTTTNSLFKAGQSIGNTTFASTQSGTWTVNPGNVANTTAWKVDGSAVTQPVSIAGNQAVNVTQMNSATVAMNNGSASSGVQRVTLADNSTGQVKLAAGTASIGNVSIDTQATGGASSYHRVSTTSTNAANVKSSAGTVYSVTAFNTSTTTAAYIKLYNTAGTPTCNSTAVVATYMVPSSSTGGGAGVAFSMPYGKAFATGIAACITGGLVDTDNTNVTANEVVLNIDYK